MKRFLLIISLLALCLTGCDERSVTQTPDALASAVLASINGAEFTPCDPDYVENSFDFEDFPTAHALYFGNEYGLEFGVFAFEDNGAAHRAAQAVRDYLAREEGAVRDLAALYPAAELSARLARYAHAGVHVAGNTVAYFLLSEADRTAAEAAFATAVK